MAPILQEEFDALAIFAAVADELRREPFFSEDNHEKLFPWAHGAVAHLCRPPFLKSAVLPFRKLWLASEPCHFETIRDLVFRVYPDQQIIASCRQWFCDFYDATLKNVVDAKWPDLTNYELVEIWLYTHAVHAGPKKLNTKKNKGKPHRRLQEFDLWSQRLGREAFEYWFRSALHIIGSQYIQFDEKLVTPLLRNLRDTAEMKLGFDAQAALRYSPYPDPRFKIHFRDVFWHLDKESSDETFERLLKRQRFENLGSLLKTLFKSRAAALVAVCESTTLDALFAASNTKVLASDESTQEQLLFSGNGGNGGLSGYGRFEVYENRHVRFGGNSEGALKLAFSDFRSVFFVERKQQSPEPHKSDWNA